MRKYLLIKSERDAQNKTENKGGGEEREREEEKIQVSRDHPFATLASV